MAPSLDRTFLLRSAFVVMLLAAAVICGYVSFTEISRLETTISEEEYCSIVETGLLRAKELVLRRIRGIATTTTMLSYAFPNSSAWPFVELNGFSEIAQTVVDLSGTTSLGFMPLVETWQIDDFEAHAKSVFKTQNFPNGTGYKEFGFGIWNKTNINGKKTILHDTTGKSPFSNRDILAPIFQHNRKKSKALMLNVHADKDKAAAIDSVMDCVDEANRKNGDLTSPPDCWAVTDWVKLMIHPGKPASLVYTPIYPANEPGKVVGFVGSNILMDLDILADSFPNDVNGIHCVIATASSTYTWRVVNGSALFEGEGDLHDPKHYWLKKEINLTDFNTGAQASTNYTLTIYPNDEFPKRYNNALSISLGFVGVVAMCAAIFFGYDYLIRRESQERKLILDIKRRFVRFISHEIRTPLNTVCLGLDLLKSEFNKEKGSEGGAGDSKCYEFKEEDISFWSDVTKDVRENAECAVAVLNDLLNYDKIESHSLKIETRQVLIWQLVKKTVKQFQIQAINRKVDLHLTIARHQDEEEGFDDSLKVMGDDIRLTQVIRNIISNALKFTPSGGNVEIIVSHVLDGLPNATIQPMEEAQDEKSSKPITTFRRAGSISISIKDSGVGLSKDQVNQLFVEGVQFNVNKLQHGGGSGLGLAIAQGIVEKHGGTISATSPGIGLGTVFTIELPLYQCFDASESITSTCSMTKSTLLSDDFNCNEPTSSDQQPDRGSINMERKRHILVVEDTVSSRKMLVRLLERAGHSCVTAGDGQEAVEAVATNQYEVKAKSACPFDTILMDYEMPVMNGPSATKKIREMGYTNIIFGVTGNVLSEDVVFFVENGANEVIGKPISMERLSKHWDNHENNKRSASPVSSISGDIQK